MHGTLGAPPRIFLTSDAVGGVWRYSMAIAAGIAARGGACTLAVMGPPAAPDQCAEAADIAGCTLVDTGLPLDWTASGPTALAEAATALAELAHSVRARTVHLHMPAMAAFDWPVPTVAVAHSCVGGWWRAMHGATPPPATFAWRMELMQQGLSRAAAIIAPSRAAASELGEIYAITRPINVVHNGLSGPPVQSASRTRRVLAAGRLWDRAKNFAVLDRAAPMLDAPIDVAGSVQGPDGTAFQSTELNLLGNLAQAGLRAAMAGAAVFAAPSIYEPFGLAVLEAAQMGAALVLSDMPSFRELWEGAAIFVDPHDAAAWAAALRPALDAPGPAPARARAERYSAGAMVDATLAVHRRVRIKEGLLF